MAQEEMTSQENPNLRLDHLAVWVEDMEKTASFLTDIVGWKRHPMVVEVSGEEATTGGMEAVFIDGNGLWLELILPTTPGPGQDILEDQGDGAIVEINFEAVNEDYEITLQKMESRGIEMLNMDGTPLVNGGLIQEGVRGDEASHESGQRIAYWPESLSRGTTIEVYEKLSSDTTNLLNIRDEQWQGEEARDRGPRIDHVVILAEDAEKTAAFYTEVMGLARIPGGAGDQEDKVVWIDTNGAKIKLLQPTGPGPLMDVLREKGDGHPLEIVAEVDALGDYIDQLRVRGGQITECNGSPAARFPDSLRRGINIAIVQRDR
jgi:catechol 2,3-dioxygenase-like lactoylglutathione lyase family enzyme